MPLNLPKELKSRLIGRVAAKLVDAKVIGDAFISVVSLRGLYDIESTLPDKGELRKQLHAYVGEWPLATFLVDELVRSFPGAGYIEGKELPLSMCEGYSDSRAVADSLIDSFESLPWLYKVTVRLPNPFGQRFAAEIGSWDLSPRHRIVSGEQLRGEFPIADTELRLGDLMVAFSKGNPPAPQWDPEAAYLQIDVDGYMGLGLTEPFLTARDDALSFFGLGLAFGLFEPNDGRPNWEHDFNGRHYFVHKHNELGWSEQKAVEIDDSHAKRIASFGFKPKPTLLSDNASWTKATLNKIGSVYRSTHGRNVALSAKWLFESYCGRDALLQFVQATVAIEILLGDEDSEKEVGLTTLMANRCAYLIGKTPQARSNLLTLFRDIYRVRSKIVHRGKSRLSSTEQVLFESLQSISKSVIVSEQQLLARAEGRLPA